MTRFPAATHPAMDGFKSALARPDLTEVLGRGVIGDEAMIDTPFGKKPLIYADYVASGRALRMVEEFVMDHVLPYYANTHTEASYCGAYSTQLRETARAEIARILGAGPDCNVIFSGSGATSALNKVVGLLDIAGLTARGGRVVVVHGPYEHHSNILPWRESGASVIEIGEGPNGGPDMDVLAHCLHAAHGADLIVGSFSAMSNVSAIVTDTDAVTRLLKQHGALAIWDYAGGGPYLPMQMTTSPGAEKDAIIFSPHKFPGGPGASGVLALRETLVRRDIPTQPGGGTVAFVSPWAHVYLPDVVAREEAGTPNVLGDIRAGLAMLVKEALGQDAIIARNAALRQRALAVWRQNPAIEILGNPEATSGLPIFSFRVRATHGGVIDHNRFTRNLSDLHGIQARGGCACAGSYGHRLLGIDQAQSDELLRRVEAGESIEKPGWVRLNLSYLISDAKADFIIAAVDSLARTAAQGLAA